MGLPIMLLCGAFLLDQHVSPPHQKSQNAAQGETGTQGHLLVSFEILTDTQGVDFAPYMQRVLEDVRKNWLALVPQSAQKKKGKSDGPVCNY